MRRVALLVLAIGACRSTPPPHGVFADCFVATDGEDAGPGSFAKPFATLARARDALRGRGGTIVVRGGAYFLEQTLTFGPEDSGLTIAAYPGEKPIVSGGIPLAWKGEGRLWVADLPGTKTRQLFVAGQRRPCARLPKEGFYKIQQLPDLKKETPWNEGQTRFRYAEGHLRAWKNLTEVEIVALHFWIESRLPVASVDEAERLVTFSKRSTFRLTDDHASAGARYYVENAFEALERPGEWCRRDGRIYYMPRPTEDPSRTQAIVPRLTRIVHVEGAHDVAFRGLIFAHAEAEENPTGWPGSDVAGAPQAAVTSPGALLFVGAKNCAIDGCVVAHVGSYGIELIGGSVANRITGNLIFDLGAGGIKIGETELKEPLTGHNEIADNFISNGGELFPSAVGVWVGHSVGNRIAHNSIHHFYYTGISVGWSWGYGPSGATENVIEFNDVYAIGQGMLSDMGAIYTLGVSPGTVIRNNVFHDIESHGYGGWGIYFDEGTTGIVAENNIVYRAKSNGFHQHYGKENIVRNNIFALNREAQIARSRAEPHLSFTFENNIVYWIDGEMLSGTWEGTNYRFRKNVYFDAKGVHKFKRPGQDDGSIVEDPLFVDPQKGDFTLQPDSPALGLGFKPIDVSTVGPRRR